MPPAVIPPDAIASVLGAALILLGLLIRKVVRDSERIARLEERAHHLEESRVRR